MEFPITTHFNGIEDDLLGGTESGGPHGTMYSNGREVDRVSDASVRFTVCTYFPFECFPNKTLFLAPVSSRYGREKKVSRRGGGKESRKKGGASNLVNTAIENNFYVKAGAWASW